MTIKIGAFATLFCLGIAWGATVPLTKVAVSTGYQPLGLIFWQFAIGIIILGAIALKRGQRLALSRNNLIYIFLLCVVGTVLPESFSYVAAVHLPAGVMAIVIAAVPMFTLCIALGIRMERLSLGRTLGVLAGAVAVVMLVAPETSLPDPEKAIYVLVALVGPLGYGLEANYIALKAPRDLDAVNTLLMVSIVGVLVVGPAAYVSGSWVDLSVPWNAPEWALVASGILHIFAYTGYIWLVGVAGAVFASQIGYIVTISGVFISAIALSESYSSWVWAALGLMLVGLALVQPRANREPQTSE